MAVNIHPHAQARLIERGATIKQVIATVETGQASPAKFDRTRFVQIFTFNAEWRGKHYANKRVEAIAAKTSSSDWLVITIIVKFF